ncbi:MAG TPA: TetR family transcriptional regulator [Solirubrobacteraceae bacterium]|nr:TetR family transcriptional regulator [Solirubrobacteraceae bacterium]
MTSAVHRPQSEIVRAAIIEATIRLIGREGVDGVTHRAVARDAGVSLSSTTYHFASRDEIVSEALRHVADLEIERIARDAETLAEGQPDVPSIARALASWLTEQVHGDDLLRVRAGYHLQLEAARRPELRAIHVAWGQAVQDLAERVLRAAGSPRPQTDARILSSAIDGLRLDEVTAPRQGFERRAQPVIERLLTILTAP